MYQKNKLHTLEMKESDNVTKHIHKFQFHLKQLLTTGVIVLDDEIVFVLMKNMCPNIKCLYIYI
jgi:hypothetical protein